ncbi:MAG: hypothetical protein WA131_04375 [Desulfitobacteriaceae bacterium]
MTSVEEINRFLLQAKILIRKNEYQLIPRKKNMDDLANLGLTIRLAMQEILELTFRHYDRGPLPDTDRQSDFVWEFIKEICSQQIYIKLKIDFRGCVCLSFHLSGGPTTLPYKDL